VRVEGFDGVLRAGERWPRATVTVAPAAPESLPTPSPSSSTPTAPVAPLQQAAVGAAPSRPLALPGPRFAEAMAAFSAGDYGEADRLFAAFVRDFPDDTRAEDAMFLIADARAHRGDVAGAREAAHVYLLRFPNGLRAPAAARLVAPASGVSPP
jgi:TolA-binding protein